MIMIMRLIDTDDKNDDINVDSNDCSDDDDNNNDYSDMMILTMQRKCDDMINMKWILRLILGYAYSK